MFRPALKVLHDPEPSSIVEVQIDRLPYDRLGRDQIDRQAVDRLERAQRLVRARHLVPLHPIRQLVAAVLQVDVDELLDFARERLLL
jgi:hypothetical protein